MIAAYLIGGIPSAGNYRLRDVLGYRPSRIEGLISATAGFMFGMTLTRESLILSGLDAVSTGTAVVNISLGLYLVIESVIRLGVTLKSVEPVPSLPVWFFFWATDRMAKRWQSR